MLSAVFERLTVSPLINVCCPYGNRQVEAFSVDIDELAALHPPAPAVTWKLRTSSSAMRKSGGPPLEIETA